MSREHEHEIIAPAIQGAQYTADDQPTRTFIGMASHKIKSLDVRYDDEWEMHGALGSEPPSTTRRVHLTITAVDGSTLCLSVEAMPGQELPGWFVAIRDQWMKEMQS